MAHFNFRRACASFIATAIMLTSVQLSPVAGTELPQTDTSGQIKQDIISTTDVAEEITQEIVSTNDALSDDHGTVLYSGTCGDSVNWSLYDSGTLVISGTGAMTDYSSYGNQAPWYSYKNSITSAIIENGVTSIGNYAFSDCTSLVSVTIPDSVTSISGSAFEGCTSLASVTIPDSVTTIGEYAFYGCKSLTSVTIGNGVKYISKSAFYGCTSLESVTIPDSVTSIGEYAFYGCKSLTSVTIPDSVTSIGDSAFSDCSSLASVTIGNGVESIGDYAFYNCTSLASITVDENNANYSSDEYGVLFNKDKTTLIQYPIGNKRTAYAIPDSVKSIGDNAFYDCTSLASVTIPDSVTTIGDYAFRGCKSLVSVTIPDSVTTIGSEAFYNCTSLESVTIPDSVTTIGDSAFYDCTSLASVTIPDSVTSIGKGAFRYCKSLASVTIPDSVTTIGEYAFSVCNSLTSVTIPDSVTSIGEYAFSYCRSLTSVTIPDSVTSIGDYAFYNCTSLASVTIGNGVKYISEGAFYGCTSLESVTIPDSVTTIGESAFYDCTSLESVTIPDSVTTIDESAFYDCTSLETITVDENNANYSNDEYGVLFNKNKTRLILYPIGNKRTAYAIPDSVTSIGDFAFPDCTSLVSVTIPDSVTTIGDYAFRYCTSLEFVTIPDSVTTIGWRAFYYCTSLATVYYGGSEDEWNNISIEFGNDSVINAEILYNSGRCGDDIMYTTSDDGVLTISGTGAMTDYSSYGNQAPWYSYKDSITSAIIEDGVTSIGEYAFDGCTSLATVYYGGSEAMWSDVEISSGNEVLLNAAVNTVPVQYLTVTLPSVVEYEYGQELCLDGLTVTEYLENGIVYQSNSYTVSAFDSLSYGKQTLTVTSSGATAIFAVTVKASEADGVIEPVTLGMTVLELKASYDGYTVYVLDSDKSTVLGDNDVIKTGCIIQLVQDGQVVDSQAVAVKCDVDGDGKLSAKDFIRLKKQILLGGCVDYPEYADANGDGTINEKDLEYLAQMIA